MSTANIDISVQNMHLLSHQLHLRALEHMPLGVSDNYRYWGMRETVFVEEMKGGTFIDVNGKEYIDFRLAYGPIILGYRDERIDKAVIDCIKNKGTICGFSTSLEVEVIEKIKSMCPNIEKLRFANSGTEAVMNAIRCARGFTRREKIVLVEGGFHGLCDEMMWRANLDNWNWKSDAAPVVESFGTGIAQASRNQVTLVSINDSGAIETLFEKHGGEIAAVIIEPIMGNCGSVSISAEYLGLLRALCSRNRSLLIVDEIKTGFRVAAGGAQELFNFSADLTTYAKALGNGYPIAAFGGRGDIMDVIGQTSDKVVHGGTYTANLIGLSAANATLTVLKTTNALQTVEVVGEKLKTILSEAFRYFDLPYSFTGHASMFGVHFVQEAPTNYRAWKKSNKELYVKFAKHLRTNGVMIEPDSREPWFMCEAHTGVNFEWLSDAIHMSLKSTLEQSVND